MRQNRNINVMSAPICSIRSVGKWNVISEPERPKIRGPPVVCNTYYYVVVQKCARNWNGAGGCFVYFLPKGVVISVNSNGGWRV